MQRCSKLRTRVDGPSKIINKIGDNANKLELPDDYNILPTFNVKDLRSYDGEDLREILFSHIRGIGARAYITYIGNSILIMENSYLGDCETLETPNMFLNSSILSFVTILTWSCFILERFVLQVKLVIALFNLEILFS